jgi:hypothetical protein
MSAPLRIHSNTLFNLSGSEQPRASAHLFNFFPFNDGFAGHTKYSGNSAQNSFGAAFV